MGTRGFRIVHFRGRYYVLYNHWDSYPEGMGQWLVDQIPQDPDEYQRWLQQQRDFFAKWDEVLQKEVLTIKNADLQATYFGQNRDYHESRQEALLDERIDGSMPPCYRTSLNDLYIEWTYTIDLDREIFSIDSGCHFKLNQIPEDTWAEALALDHDDRRLILPHLVPADSLASVTSQPKEPGHNLKRFAFVYEQLSPRFVYPKGYTDFDPVISHGPAILNNIWLIFRSKLEGEMPYVLLGLSPNDFPFREIAFAIVSLAAGLTDSLTFVDTRRLKGDLRNGYMGIVDDADPKGPAHFAAELAVGCHLEGFQPGSAPAASSYWFRGVLIRLESQLNQPDAVQQAIVLAVECGRRESQDSNFDAILLSIEHAVILRVFPDRVEHTELLSLLQIPIHYTKSSLDRYPLEVRCEIEGWEEPTHLKVLAEEGDSSTAVNQDSPTTSDVFHPATTHYEPSAFMALLHCFEATTVRSLSRASTNGGWLPAELYAKILDYVDDETYRACLKVSRCFRRHCLKNLRIIKGAVVKSGHLPSTAQTPELRDPNTETLIFDLFDAGTDSTIPSQIRSGQLSDAERPSYRRKKTQEEQSTVWQVLVGRQSALSLVVCFIFSNFQAQFHLQGSEAITTQRSPSPRRMPAPSSSSHGTGAPNGQYWNSFSVYNSVNVPSLSSAAVFNIWLSILPSHKIHLNSKGDDWTVPPNTKYGYVGGTYTTGDVERKFEEQWFMCLVVKRSSATTHPSEVWERALEEAEAEVCKQTALQNDQSMSVVIAVELSAKLFTWNVKLCALVQEPQRVLEILAEGDREIIQGFLLDVAAAQKRREEAQGHRTTIQGSLQEVAATQEKREEAEDVQKDTRSAIE